MVGRRGADRLGGVAAAAAGRPGGHAARAAAPEAVPARPWERAEVKIAAFAVGALATIAAGALFLVAQVACGTFFGAEPGSGCRHAGSVQPPLALLLALSNVFVGLLARRAAARIAYALAAVVLLGADYFLFGPSEPLTPVYLAFLACALVGMLGISFGVARRRPPTPSGQ
jgi:hypothetical protein